MQSNRAHRRLVPLVVGGQVCAHLSMPKARALLNAGQARVLRQRPFTIEILHRINESGVQVIREMRLHREEIRDRVRFAKSGKRVTADNIEYLQTAAQLNRIRSRTGLRADFGV